MPQTGKRRAARQARHVCRKPASAPPSSSSSSASSSSSSSSASPGKAPWEAEVPVKPGRGRAAGPDLKSRSRGQEEARAAEKQGVSPQDEDLRDVAVKSDYQGAVARAILFAVGHISSHSRLPVAPRRVVNFLKGNQFPRPQEREGAWAECFGLLQSHERAWLEEALESLVERGFLELEAGSAGRQGGVRLSPQGKRALRGLEAIPAGVLPERPVLGAHPEAEERLRLARQELAVQKSEREEGQ